MLDLQQIYTILRYVAQIAVVYLLMRYTPFIKLDTVKALILTVMIVALMLVVEKICVQNIPSEPTTEEFDSGCSTCSGNIENFEDNKPARKCRVVCDGDKGNDGGNDENRDDSFVPPRGSEPKDNINNESDLVRVISQPVPEGDRGKNMNSRVSDSNGNRDIDRDSDMRKPVNDDRYYWGTRYGSLGYDNRYGFGGMFYDEYPYYNRYRNNDLERLRNTGEYLDQEYDDEMRERKERQNVQDWETRIERRARSTEGYGSRYQQVGSKSQYLKPNPNRRSIEGELDDELPYTDYNNLPVASGYKSHDYEYGYSFLP